MARCLALVLQPHPLSRHICHRFWHKIQSPVTLSNPDRSRDRPICGAAGQLPYVIFITQLSGQSQHRRARDIHEVNFLSRVGAWVLVTNWATGWVGPSSGAGKFDFGEQTRICPIAHWLRGEFLLFGNRCSLCTPGNWIIFVSGCPNGSLSAITERSLEHFAPTSLHTNSILCQYHFCANVIFALMSFFVPVQFFWLMTFL